MSEEEGLKEQLAYEEMTLAAAIIVSKIKEFPHLLDQLCREIEIALIKIAVDRTKGNIAAAARLLGLNRTTLVEKRKRYKMELKTLNET